MIRICKLLENNMRSTHGWYVAIDMDRGVYASITFTETPRGFTRQVREELLGKLARRSNDDTDFCVAIFTSLEGDNSLLSSGWNFHTEKLPNEYYGDAKKETVKMNLTTFLEKYA